MENKTDNLQITVAGIAHAIQRTCIDTQGKHNIPEGWELNKIAQAVYDNCKKYKIEPFLCIAQGIAESHFAINPAGGRPRKHKNIFNWLNTDDGKNHTFKSFEAGIEQYCKTMSREYLWKNERSYDNPKFDGWVTLEMMQRHDFHRPIGGRYASAKNYTENVVIITNRVRKIMVEFAQKEAQEGAHNNG